MNLFIKKWSQYNAALAIKGAIRRTSREELCQELSLESLSKRRWYRKLYYFFCISSEHFLALAKHMIQELMIRFPSLAGNIIFL